MGYFLENLEPLREEQVERFRKEYAKTWNMNIKENRIKTCLLTTISRQNERSLRVIIKEHQEELSKEKE